ncbi:MAG: rhodanese-like domain-containing protein [Candidatus Hodarchaeales archaeon]|jgi:rhodanese-related sulfurtransferase
MFFRRNIPLILPKEAKSKFEKGDLYILDIREDYEVNYVNLIGNEYSSNWNHIKMQEIPIRLSKIPKTKDVGVICHHGARSAQVTMFLQQQGFKNVKNIEGGIDRWSLEADSSVQRYSNINGRIIPIN